MKKEKLNGIEIPHKIQKAVKGEKKFQLVTDSVVYETGQLNKDGTPKLKSTKIVNISPFGFYCEDDKFYEIELF